MTKVRTGPNCASIGLAHDAFTGVKHSSTLARPAQRRSGTADARVPQSWRGYSAT